MTVRAVNEINGGGITSGHFNDAGTVSCRLDVPAGGRLAQNGTHPRLIRELGLWIGGFGGSAVVSVFAGGASSGQFGVGSGQAGWPGRVGLGGTGQLIDGGTSLTIGYTSNRGTYYGRNAMGGNSINHSGGLSNGGNSLAGEYALQDLPSAVNSPAVQQVGVTAAKITWAAPDDDGGGFEGITGYRVAIATDWGTLAGYQYADVPGSAREVIFQNVPAGVYELRIWAYNTVVSVTGYLGADVYPVTFQMIAATGNIDGWAGYGSLPSGAQPVTAAGVRRATITALPGSPSALLRETNVVVAPVSLAADLYGIQRDITGLTPGKVYRVEAQAAYVGTAIDANTPNIYQIGRSGGPYGDPVEIITLNDPVALPAVEFTATASTQTIRVRLHEAVTRTAAGELERLAVWNIRVSEIASVSPYRLRSIAFESSLLNHFDLANNSVGARWWVDNEGVTQFSADLGSAGAVATFTDHREDDKLEYVDIQTTLDTRAVVNDLNVTNHGAVADGSGGWNADDDTLNYTDLTSIATNGIRKGTMDMSLYDAGTYAGSVDSRAAGVLTGYADPEFTVTGFRWNAQEDPDLAARLDIYSPVDIEFRGNTYELRIVNIQHILTPKRWIMVLQLDRR